MEMNSNFKEIMNYPPILKSKRLVTRGLQLSDVQIWNTFIQDERATALFPESMRQPNTAQIWIEKQIERYQNKEYGLLALIDQKNETFIGQCGLLMQELEHGHEVEIGYHILPEFWGQSYATEAAQLIKLFAIEELGLKRLVSVINPKNIGSQKVAQRNCMHKERQINYRNMPADLWVWEEKDKV